MTLLQAKAALSLRGLRLAVSCQANVFRVSATPRSPFLPSVVRSSPQLETALIEVLNHA